MRARALVDQAAEDGLADDQCAVDADNGEVGGGVFTAGTRWAIPWCRAAL